MRAGSASLQLMRSAVLLMLAHGCAGTQRTELYFGQSRPDGSLVTSEQWDAFVDEVVTPRFPDGFTIVEGRGQYRDSAGRIIREPAKVIILFHERDARSSCSIEEIRDEYMARFEQESVLHITSGARMRY